MYALFHLWDAAGDGILPGLLCAGLWLNHILVLLHEPLPDNSQGAHPTWQPNLLNKALRCPRRPLAQVISQHTEPRERFVSSFFLMKLVLIFKRVITQEVLSCPDGGAAHKLRLQSGAPGAACLSREQLSSGSGRARPGGLCGRGRLSQQETENGQIGWVGGKRGRERRGDSKDFANPSLTAAVFQKQQGRLKK